MADKVIDSRDVPNFGITEISAEAEIRFRFHLGISISAKIRPK
jgi:hypothetical protein